MRRFVIPALSILMILVATAGIEYSMGRTPFYQYGPVALWSGDINSNANSQQIADPYTFTHIIHGFAFYGLLTLVPGPLSLGTRAVIAVAAESSWEMVENSSFIINRYRAETISLDYYGDSIINSVFDILACLLGFWIASRLRTRWTILLAILIELALAYFIRDNLTLNIIQLLYPIHAIKLWQMGL